MIPLLLCSAIAVQDTTFAETESAAYAVETLNTPEGCVLEVGGMDFLPDGRLVVSTRRGQVWIVDDPLRDDFENAKITLFHEGLWEGLGLDVRDGEIYVLQRGELSKLSDSDGDGRCDVVETITNEWGLSGHYHEFAFGLPRDSAGHWWAGLNVSFGDPEWWHGRSTVPYRGWILRIGADGEVTPWASGVRSPNGVAVDSKDRVLVTDNQGDWIASSPIYHIQKDAFYGHPKSLNWTDEYRASGKLAHDEIPPARAATGRTSPAIWIPYKWSRSTGNLFEDVTDGKFGVPNGQYVVAELTNGMILRAGLEEVQGQLQGWIVPLRTELGSVNRVIQAPDGSVFCGLTNRGWGGAAPADGLRRVRSTGLETMEIAGMTLLDYDEEYEACGFELSFGHPIADGWEPGDETVTAIRYDYDYWWEYGSPERHVTPMENTALQLSDDRTKLVVRSYDLFPAQCVRITLEGVTAASGAPLLHPEIAYTVNQLPSGAPTNAYVAKVVPPPPSKGDADAGVLRLSWGDALGQFEAEGWELCQATLAEDRRSFETSEGNGALVNVGPSATDFVTRGSFGDAHLHVEFMLPEGSRSAIALGDLGRIELTDDAATCGTFRDTAPTTGGYAGAGQWTPLDVYFRRGSADAPAFLDRVELGGTTIHEGVEISGTSGERSPITFVGTAGQIALRNIQVKPLDRPEDGGDWTFLDPSAAWDDWILMGDCEFTLENDELVGKGALGWLWAPESLEVGDVTVRARVKINANGAGALVVRAQDGDDGGVDGYAVRINASYDDERMTGSIEGDGAETPVATQLIAADTWVDLEVDVRDTDAGTRVVVSLNGIVVNEALDPDGFDPGGLALRCDHDGTVFKVQNVRIRR